MGFLDDLKHQALLKQQEHGELVRSSEANEYLVNEKLDLVFRYFHDLSKQLMIVQPAAAYNFHIPGVGDLDGLKLGNLRANLRRKTEGENFSELIDRVTFSMSYCGNGAFNVARREPGLADRLKNFLYRHGFKHELEEVRDDRGITVSTKFEILCEVRTLTVVKGDPASRKISIVTKNIERLGEQEFIFFADQVDEVMLDEFAKFTIGENNTFRLIPRAAKK